MTAVLSQSSNCIICKIDTSAEIHCSKATTRGEHFANTYKMNKMH